MPYQPIPVEAAKELAERFGKSIVIVCAYDPEHGMLHTTTYGTNEQSKAWAADGGKIAAKALGAMPDQATFYENYRRHCCAASGHIQILDGVDGPVARCVAHPQADAANGSTA